MGIVTLQAQFRELGRIRTGQLVESRGGRKRPDKLGTFRLTSPNRGYLERAAAVYGGQVGPWTGPDGDEWELITETDTLPINVPPGRTPISQWFEMWGAGGCLRRCTGEREVLSDQPCLCPEDPGDRNDLAAKGEACKPTTRLSVVLPDLPDVGVWLLVTHSYYGAVELMGTANLLQAAAGVGRFIPAQLRIDHRQVKRQGQARKDFIVPVIELGQTMSEMVAALPGPTTPLGIPAEAGQPPALPEPPALPAEPAFVMPPPPEPAAATEEPLTGDAVSVPDQSEQTETVVEVMTREAFKAALDEHRIDVAYAVAFASTLLGRKVDREHPLTDDERPRVIAALLAPPPTSGEPSKELDDLPF